MSESKESELKNEIDEISKTIDTILKKIEVEREKLLPSDSSDKSPGNEGISAETESEEAGPSTEIKKHTPCDTQENPPSK